MTRVIRHSSTIFTGMSHNKPPFIGISALEIIKKLIVEPLFILLEENDKNDYIERIKQRKKSAASSNTVEASVKEIKQTMVVVNVPADHTSRTSFTLRFDSL